MKSVRDCAITFVVVSAIIASFFAVYMLFAPKAKADGYDFGCETIHWGFLGSQRRIICDGPKRPDGSWERGRVILTPAHYVPRSCYFGTYSSSCSGGYQVDTTVQARESYIVFDSNVLPDEPGWLPPGTDTLR
ncbi:membrane protein [Mycobacterium phage Indlulamithi]|uniref:CDGP domain-containing protein n=1 Tax=Mycobacterium phage Indlulamithi TaxID=2656582 RepID=A0A649VD03_9CAUD|nr:membrane protein [Mycobacterium phage Indlulamithi]QGJ90094.1 hypothetical protein PBI_INDLULAMITHI_55 [Mycobacterium phage Indlulamithi]